MHILRSLLRTTRPTQAAVICLMLLIGSNSSFAQVPDWSVDASAFEHSHNATAAVLNGDARLSGGDHRLAAFVSGEIRGVTEPTEVNGQWLFFLTIHGETSGERVTFRAYDASADRILNISQTLDFSVNGITGSPSNPLWLDVSQSTSNDAPSPAAPHLRLHQNAPNPFTDGTRLSFEVPHDGHVTLEVFDLLGRRLAVVVDEQRTAGLHTVDLDAGNLATGRYLYRLSTIRSVQTRMMVVR